MMNVSKVSMNFGATAVVRFVPRQPQSGSIGAKDVVSAMVGPQDMVLSITPKIEYSFQSELERRKDFFEKPEPITGRGSRAEAGEEGADVAAVLILQLGEVQEDFDSLKTRLDQLLPANALQDDNAEQAERLDALYRLTLEIEEQLQYLLLKQDYRIPRGALEKLEASLASAEALYHQLKI